MARMKRSWTFFGVLIFFVSIRYSDSNCFGCPGRIKLESDGPALLDAPTSINATILNAHEFEGPFFFNFSKSKSRNIRHVIFKLFINTFLQILANPLLPQTIILPYQGYLLWYTFQMTM